MITADTLRTLLTHHGRALGHGYVDESQEDLIYDGAINLKQLAEAINAAQTTSQPAFWMTPGAVNWLKQHPTPLITVTLSTEFTDEFYVPVFTAGAKP